VVAVSLGFSGPRGVCCSPDGKILYISDVGSCLIRSVDISSREVTTLIKTKAPGAGSYLERKNVPGEPRFLTLNQAGDVLYITVAKGFLMKLNLKPSSTLHDLKQAGLHADWLNDKCWSLVAEYSTHCKSQPCSDCCEVTFSLPRRCRSHRNREVVG
jgi:hypothetical protein